MDLSKSSRLGTGRRRLQGGLRCAGRPCSKLAQGEPLRRQKVVSPRGRRHWLTAHWPRLIESIEGGRGAAGEGSRIPALLLHVPAYCHADGRPQPWGMVRPPVSQVLECPKCGFNHPPGTQATTTAAPRRGCQRPPSRDRRPSFDGTVGAASFGQNPHKIPSPHIKQGAAKSPHGVAVEPANRAGGSAHSMWPARSRCVDGDRHCLL